MEVHHLFENMEKDGPLAFRDAVLEWYHEQGRDFYWRAGGLSPWELLLTELLLKRTRAETVEAHGPPILSCLSTPRAVLELDQEELAEILQPLGLYNRRSKNIRSVCQSLVEQHGGTVPAERDQLLEISGVGEYTADAVRCFAYGQPVLVLDTNVIAVAEYYFGLEGPSDPRLDDTIRPTLSPLVPADSPREFNWALLDLGAALRAAGDATENDPLDLGPLPVAGEPPGTGSEF